jgi:hypothetical protein
MTEERYADLFSNNEWGTRREPTAVVMAGLGPAIHVFDAARK